jgi:hypothetical protein
MRCQHCYTRITVYPGADGIVVYAREGVDPAHHTLADRACVPGDLRIEHKPMPTIEVSR